MRRLSLRSLFLIGLLLMFTAGPARAEDPPYVEWSSGYGPLQNSAVRDAYCSIHHG